MTAPTRMMGYEGLLYYGAAGSTAATQITNSRDIKYSTKPRVEEVTIRGDGSSIPKVVHRPVALEVSELSWNMLNKSDDTTLTALIAAAQTGAAVAIRFIRSTGKLGFDGDVFISCEQGAPLGGVGTIDFKVEGVDISTREPSLNA